ncbi:CinA-like protein [Leifsonia xyli subsp. cynodontis DSM 46306]|uniref:Uncharacterized protein n=2 Tax=Leifsonia xyli TaxID=1575 RepID=U3PFP0_LEIXC|nr:CinA-like protein [Leifsonia xyli subsp. cynodontis DSM 46306]
MMSMFSRSSTSAEADRRVVVASLRHTARGLDAAADRASTIVAEDQRRRAAAQVRFVAVLVATGGHDGMAGPWLVAGRRLLVGYDRVDMDAIYADRLARREVRR